MNELPAEIVLHICRCLHSRTDYVYLCSVSKGIREKCSMKTHESKVLFSRFLAEENWKFDHAKKWMVNHATKRPFLTIILLEVILPGQPGKADTLGQELASLYEKHGQQKNAMEILRVIWRYWTQDGRLPLHAYKTGSRLAELYEQTGQQEDVMEIRRHQAQLIKRRTEAGNRLLEIATLLEQAGQMQAT